MEEQIMRNEWQRHTIKEVAAMLGRSYQAVAVQASRLGLKKGHYGIVWTPQQIQLLRTYFPVMFNKPLALWIGVSQRTMLRKARELGLEKEPGFIAKRQRDISSLASAALRECESIKRTQFKKGVHNSPATEFKPGHKLSPEAEANLKAAMRHSWKMRKAKEELDRSLHPERYNKTQ
jgi:hypothetical protein